MSQTEILAVWGAITGTIGTFAGLLGLWLRLKQHELDKAELSCESSFEYESPTRSKHRITIRSTGRRPVTIDHVRYFITPRTWKHKIIKKLLHKKGRWIWDQEPKTKAKLSEGEKTEIFISLPNGIEIHEIYKSQIIDQSGKPWPIKWPSTKSLAKIATIAELITVTEENEKRVVHINGHRLGERFFLETNFNTKPSRTGITCGRSFWFVDNKKYLEKLQDIQRNQIPRFLSAEVEEIV
jgi:hypothetical protein